MKKIINTILLLFIVSTIMYGQGETCASAFATTVNPYGNCTSGFTIDTGSATGDGEGACEAATDPDVWISFIAPASGDIQFTYVAGTADAPDVTILFGSCGTLVEGYCDNLGLGDGDIVTGFTPGGTYYIRFSNDTFDALGTSTICIADGANPACSSVDSPADACDNAPLIDLSQAFAGSTGCSYTINTGGDTDPTCGGISLDNSSFFRFTAAAADVDLDWAITGGNNCTGAASSTGVQIGVFSGTCGSLTFIGGTNNCLNPTGGVGSMGTFSMSGLTIGEDYYIMIDGYSGDECDYNITPQGGVAITPDNDVCMDASSIACGTTEIGDIVLATATDAPTACTNGGTPNGGVWYTFTGDGSTVTISTSNVDTNFDTELNVYSGSCGTLVCVAGDDDSGAMSLTSEVSFATTNSTVYYIYLDGLSGAVGTYGLSLTCVGCPDGGPGTLSWN